MSVEAYSAIIAHYTSQKILLHNKVLHW